MSWSLFAREYERTCQDCGFSWRVPRSIARRGIRGMSAMSVRGATSPVGRGGPGGWQYYGRGDIRGGPAPFPLDSGIAARAERMEGYQICAKCGVDKFTQRPVRGS